tara:strand:- start:210 stop:962 length:753 start_codon:yes stop_codon:yes gene_type:complete
MDYIICIPSYERATICNQKTLTTLHNNNINPELIYVYVANEIEFDIYLNFVDKKFYNKIIVGVPGLAQQRQFIMDQFPENKQIIFMDDDVEFIDLSFTNYLNLENFFQNAFQTCIFQKSFIWGVYPVFNPFFRKPRKEITTHLTYIVGAMYGIINRPNLQSIKLNITLDTSQKEDIERSIKYFIEDGIVVRFNKIGFKTKYYGKTGGLGTFKNRLEPMKQACIKLNEIYSDYGKIKIRSSGMHEFVLKKL